MRRVELVLEVHLLNRRQQAEGRRRRDDEDVLDRTKKIEAELRGAIDEEISNDIRPEEVALLVHHTQHIQPQPSRPHEINGWENTVAVLEILRSHLLGVVVVEQQAGSLDEHILHISACLLAPSQVETLQDGIRVVQVLHGARFGLPEHEPEPLLHWGEVRILRTDT